MCLIKRLPIALEREMLAEQVVESYGLDPHEVCVILDNADSGHYPAQRYTFPAFCVDPSHPEIDPISPPEIQAIFEASGCKQLIWISKSLVESPDATFIWAISHELQHAWQNNIYPELSMTNRFIANFYSIVFGNDPYPIDIPTELDAELSAMESIETLQGEFALNQHLDNERNTNPERLEYIDNLINRRSNWPGVIEATRLILLDRNQGLVHVLQRNHALSRLENIHLEWILGGEEAT